MADEDADRTPEEQRVIDSIADVRGEDWAEEHAELILTQARLIGDI